jgi:hypothetical protein
VLIIVIHIHRRHRLHHVVGRVDQSARHRQRHVLIIFQHRQPVAGAVRILASSAGGYANAKFIGVVLPSWC